MFKILIDSLLDLCTLFPYLDFGLVSLSLSCYGLYKRLYDPETDKNWQAKLSFELASLISTNLNNPNWSIAFQILSMLDFVNNSLKEMVRLTHAVQLIQRHTRKKRHWIHIQLSQHLKHLLYALLFLFHIMMNIEIQCCTDIWMAQQDTDSFIITVTLNTPGGKTMT